MKKYLLLLFIACILTLSTQSILAQEEVDYDRVNEVAKQMNCPTCVGINLADCRTQTCNQWRDQISDLLKEGYSDQEILDHFETRYGTRVLLEPPKEGSTLLLWILPIIAIVLAGGWLLYTMRGWQQPETVAATPQTPTATDISDDYLSQVDQDLQN